MYQYSYADQKLVDERVAQFRDQTQRFLAGELSEEQFLPLRLQNGLYIQRHAPCLWQTHRPKCTDEITQKICTA